MCAFLYLLHFSPQCEGIDGEPDHVPPSAVDEPGLAAALAVAQAAEDKEAKYDSRISNIHPSPGSERGIVIFISVHYP